MTSGNELLNSSNSINTPMKLKWPGFNEQGSIILNLAADTFCFTGKEIIIDGNTFTAKDELHITLLNRKTGLLLQQKLDQDQAAKIRLKNIFEEIDWSFRLTGPLHILSRQHESMLQKTIIMLIEMPGMAKLYAQIKEEGLISPEVPVPPPHITLYTHNCYPGIGVPGSVMLDALSEKSFSLEQFKSRFNLNSCDY